MIRTHPTGVLSALFSHLCSRPGIECLHSQQVFVQLRAWSASTPFLGVPVQPRKLGRVRAFLLSCQSSPSKLGFVTSDSSWQLFRNIRWWHYHWSHESNWLISVLLERSFSLDSYLWLQKQCRKLDVFPHYRFTEISHLMETSKCIFLFCSHAPLIPSLVLNYSLLFSMLCAHMCHGGQEMCGCCTEGLV